MTQDLTPHVIPRIVPIQVRLHLKRVYRFSLWTLPFDLHNLPKVLFDLNFNTELPFQ